MRSPFTLACLVCSVLFVGVVVSGNDDKDERRSDDARVQRGFAITPVKLTFKKKDRDLVGLGSYIVNAQGGCNDCHKATRHAFITIPQEPPALSIFVFPPAGR